MPSSNIQVLAAFVFPTVYDVNTVSVTLISAGKVLANALISQAQLQLILASTTIEISVPLGVVYPITDPTELLKIQNTINLELKAFNVAYRAFLVNYKAFIIGAIAAAP